MSSPTLSSTSRSAGEADSRPMDTPKPKEGSMVTRWGVKGLILLALLVGAAINLVPVLWMLSTSLKDNTQAFAYPPTW
ncbi:MAG: hypothetical protein WBA46_00685, partial [Thermomicrobiales bacterium]